MGGPYEYYKEVCNCSGAGIRSSGAGSYNTMHSFMLEYCQCPPDKVHVCMRNLEGEEVRTFPVGVYNVNEQLLGEANTKAQYIAIWNSDPANQAVGRLSSGVGPFCFTLTMVDGQVPPPWVIGEGGELDYGIYESAYEEAYE